MKKKALLLFFVATMSHSFMHATVNELVIGTPVVLQLIGNDDDDLSTQMPKMPILPPSVSIANHTLYFYDVYNEVVPVELTDATGNVVYSDYLPAGTQTLSLPTTLSGTYTLFIYMGNYIFAGQINL